VKPYLENTHHKKGLMEWLKVKGLSSNPSTEKKKKKRSPTSRACIKPEDTQHKKSFETHKKQLKQLHHPLGL
jgi:hypothetical protein